MQFATRTALLTNMNTAFDFNLFMRYIFLDFFCYQSFVHVYFHDILAAGHCFYGCVTKAMVVCPFSGWHSLAILPG